MGKDVSEDPLTKAIASTETMRLAVPRSSGLLHTPVEKRFERITRIATRLLEIPVAAITVFHQDEEWFKSVQGWDVGKLPMSDSFGKLAAVTEDMVVSPDTLDDERTKNHVLVSVAPNYRFYAGIRLYERHGQIVGTLSLMDTTPRQLTDEEVESIGDLGAIAQNEILSDQISNAQAILTAKLSAARREALIDPLTRVWNRRGAHMALKTAFTEADEAESFISIAIVDVDKFKRINDEHGHDVGDVMLRKIAESLVRNLREVDIVCRLGGDEFLVILIDADAQLANTALNRVLGSLESEPLRTREGDVEVTVTAGFTVREPGSKRSFEEMILHADQALMAAKSEGRNRVLLAS